MSRVGGRTIMLSVIRPVKENDEIAASITASLELMPESASLCNAGKRSMPPPYTAAWELAKVKLVSCLKPDRCLEMMKLHSTHTLHAPMKSYRALLNQTPGCPTPTTRQDVKHAAEQENKQNARGTAAADLPEGMFMLRVSLTSAVNNANSLSAARLCGQT